ncbi:hypothetical protein FSP39_012801 [Pinctada imbricata]|uniref:Vitelline membrane outer layer 1-like protein n=1 Tax=Pinctada imbricata TaxID=66713 RepID=A0AA89C9Y2_PINIB|nr:hypothetical protein FSP39_012801 [Pinctada imbricata]
MFLLKHEPNQGNGDDSALNNIALFCADRHSTSYKSITSSPPPGWGVWGEPVFCEGEDVFLTSFILQLEPDQGNGDDSAANFVNFRCRKFAGGDHRIISCGGRYLWGEYGEWSASCPPGSAICGMKTKWEAYQGAMAWNDDSALNDVIFFCCN